MQHASIQGRVRGGEREKDREATRERETCNTSNQGRVRGGMRESDNNEREATRERKVWNTSNQGRVSKRERKRR